MEFNLNANDQSQGWKFSLSHQQAQNSMENRRKSEDNEMQLKTGRQAWKISKKRFSQTVRRPISQCENSPTQIRNAKISQCEISQCQMPFRNAKFKIRNANSNFAMRKFRNAKFRNAKYHFAMPILNLHYLFQFRNAKISQCEISQCQSPFRIAKFTAFAKFTFAGLVILCN